MHKSCLMLVALVLLPISSLLADDYDTGLEAFNTLDYEKALAIWQPLAEAGDANAQFGLGQMYGNGFGVMMDDAAALNWYGLAAEQGHGQALSNLAVMHQNGWGVEMNEAEAIRLFTLAAESGVAEAMTAVGRYYAMDFSDNYDPVVAYKWFSIAAMLDDLDAAAKIELIAPQMSAEQLDEATALVTEWKNENQAKLAAYDY
ncbi:MAG: tetratricopeptide repeat protein [Pseudomonadota bacterium]